MLLHEAKNIYGRTMHRIARLFKFSYHFKRTLSGIEGPIRAYTPIYFITLTVYNLETVRLGMNYKIHIFTKLRSCLFLLMYYKKNVVSPTYIFSV